MIEIKKNTEPIELRTLREQAARDGISPEEAYKRLQCNSELKKKVKDSLITEQGKLCAYCMCRIPRNDVAVEIAPITIEHFIPRNPEDGRDVGQGLDYNNLLAVCHGNRGPKGTRHENDLTCDAHRKNTEFMKINPCDPETLQTITYTLDGKIDATDIEVRKDLVDTLNLNCPTSPLISERKAALDGLIEEICTIEDEEGLRTYCGEILDSFQNETGEKTPYVGILIWYLRQLVSPVDADR